MLIYLSCLPDFTVDLRLTREAILSVTLQYTAEHKRTQVRVGFAVKEMSPGYLSIADAM